MRGLQHRPPSPARALPPPSTQKSGPLNHQPQPGSTSKPGVAQRTPRNRFGDAHVLRTSLPRAIPQRRNQEPGPRPMNMNRLMMQRNPSIKRRTDLGHFDQCYQRHGEINYQMVPSAIAIESTVGFIEHAIRLHVHQAGCSDRIWKRYPSTISKSL